METVNIPEKTRLDYHADFMEKLTPQLINKVSRIVSQRRAMHLAMQAASEQYLGAHNEIKRLEGEKAYIVASGARGGRDEVTILDRRIGAAKLLLEQLSAEKERLREPYRVATTIGEGVLKALADELGGGNNQAELFETMGWR